MRLSPELQELLEKEIITSNQLQNLTKRQLRNLTVNLTYEGVRSCFTNPNIGLTLEQAVGLTRRQLRNLESEEVRACLADPNIDLNINQAIRLTIDQRENLESKGVRLCLVDSNIDLNVKQAIKLEWYQRQNLESKGVRLCLADPNIGLTLKQAIKLRTYQRQNLESKGVRLCLADPNIDLTLKQAIRLTRRQLRNLNAAGVCLCLTDPNTNLNVDQAIRLTLNQRRNLEHEFVRVCLADPNMGLTLQAALCLTGAQRTALSDIETQARLRDPADALTIQDIVANPVHPALNVFQPQAPNFNGSQSTHTASVHQSTSQSAAKLANLYQSIMNEDGLEKVIQRIKNYVNSLSDDSLKNKAAKRCIQRITESNYTFTDPSSQVTTRELLALAFLAIQDDNKRTGTLEDALTEFIEGLYEIQRGYNLSNADVDQGGNDKPICAAGTFNKLIEKLQGIHPNVIVKFITKETASLKLMRLVPEKVLEYLNNRLENSKTVEKLTELNQKINELKEEGVEAIWKHIKKNIAESMFDEFGTLYKDNTDPEFLALVDNGIYAELDEKILQAIPKAIQTKSFTLVQALSGLETNIEEWKAHKFDDTYFEKNSVSILRDFDGDTQVAFLQKLQEKKKTEEADLQILFSVILKQAIERKANDIIELLLAVKGIDVSKADSSRKTALNYLETDSPNDADIMGNIGKEQEVKLFKVLMEELNEITNRNSILFNLKFKLKLNNPEFQNELITKAQNLTNVLKKYWDIRNSATFKKVFELRNQCVSLLSEALKNKESEAMAIIDALAKSEDEHQNDNAAPNLFNGELTKFCDEKTLKRHSGLREMNTKLLKYVDKPALVRLYILQDVAWDHSKKGIKNRYAQSSLLFGKGRHHDIDSFYVNLAGTNLFDRNSKMDVESLFPKSQESNLPLN